MNKLIVVAAASTLMFSIPALGVDAPALAQSATGEAASGGIAGGDSFGSDGSARGGNGPSQTGEAASGGVAGGDAPGKSANAGGANAAGSVSADAMATGSITADDENEDVPFGIEVCGDTGQCR